MRTTVPDSEQLPRFAGVATFCRFPLIEAVPDDCRPVDWVVYSTAASPISPAPGSAPGQFAMRRST
jgi:hypothetical protein